LVRLPRLPLFPYTTLFRSKERIAAKKARVAELLGPDAGCIDELNDRFDDAYWIAEPEDIIALNIPLYALAKRNEDKLTIHAQYRSEEHTSELQSRENLVCR